MSPGDVFLPSFVHLYDGTRADSVDFSALLDFVRSILPNSKVEARQDVVFEALHPLAGPERDERVTTLARLCAQARVQDPTVPKGATDTSYAEIEYEKRRLRDPGVKALGVLYDGWSLVSAYADIIPAAQLSVEHAHIVFTNQLFGTFDENDRRYHARVLVCGYPSLISTLNNSPYY